LSDDLADVPVDIFGEKDDFVRETKIVPWEEIQWKWKKPRGK
jgi:hypothetical protein